MRRSTVLTWLRFGSVALLCLFDVHAQPPFTDAADWPKTDFSHHAVDLNEFVEGGPGKDGIPSIDAPVFVSVQAAEQWLDRREPVIAFVSEREARAYPLQILIYHEIVNDRVGEQAIVVTYCPLCNAAIVFARMYDGELLEFGTSGKVHTNNLVMYDRASQSWWLQFTGTGVVGEYAGAQLQQLPSQIVSFEQFKTAHPAGLVLSRQTGFDKRYGTNPYTGYDSRRLPYGRFFSKPPDARLPAMERVLGVVSQNEVHAFPFSRLNTTPLIQSRVDGQPVVVFSRTGIASAVDQTHIRNSKETLSAAAYSPVVEQQVLGFKLLDGRIVDVQTNSSWNIFGEAVAGPLQGQRLRKVDQGVYFAFVWLDFYPQSEIHAP